MLKSEVLSCFSGVIMSIKSFFLFPSDIDLQKRQSGKTFLFGPSKSYPSLIINQVIIPANIDDIELEIVVDIVDCKIPLLLSKQFMKDADSTPDFVGNCITMYGK